jgi:hypothetical protein
MDDTLKKAFDIANYMATLSSQKHILKEEFHQNLIHYQNGGTFTVSKELINFVNTLLQLNNSEDVVLIDDNDQPTNIENLKEFFDTILDIYQQSVVEYYTKFQSLKNNRSVEGLVSYE